MDEIVYKVVSIYHHYKIRSTYASFIYKAKGVNICPPNNPFFVFKYKQNAVNFAANALSLGKYVLVLECKSSKTETLSFCAADFRDIGQFWKHYRETDLNSLENDITTYMELRSKVKYGLAVTPDLTYVVNEIEFTKPIILFIGTGSEASEEEMNNLWTKILEAEKENES